MAVESTPTPQAMREQLSLAFTHIPFNQLLGLELQHLTDKEALLGFSMKEALIGNVWHGILHGGVIAAVLDMAGGMVAMSAAIEQQNTHRSSEEWLTLLTHCATVDLQVSYLRPGKGAYFTAQASLLKSSHKIAFARMELNDNQNKLIATGSATYLFHAK